MMRSESAMFLLLWVLFEASEVLADCTNPPVPTNGHLLTNVTTVNELSYVTQVCDTGYKGTPTSSQIYCYNGSWIGNNITCTIVDCGLPSLISNGKVTLDANITTYNSTATIMCNNGFTVNGTLSITCQNTGVWSTGGICQKINCSEPVPPTNGSIRQKTGIFYGDVATVECDVGYNRDVIPSNSIVCAANGMWTPTITCIIVACGPPPVPVNGSVSLDSGTTVYQSTATQRCNYGYFLGNSTSARIECQSTGFWQTGIICNPKDCGAPPAPSNGSVTLKSSNTLILSKATQACQVGFKPVGPSPDIFCLDYGWSTNLTGIRCQILDCRTPWPISNGQIDSPSSTVYQSIARVQCNNGYTISTNATIQCLSTGLWSKPGTCTEKDCGQPPMPTNGTVTLDTGTTLFQATATQTCNDTYAATNAKTHTIVCLATGNWSTGITCTEN